MQPPPCEKALWLSRVEKNEYPRVRVPEEHGPKSRTQVMNNKDALQKLRQNAAATTKEGQENDKDSEHI